MEFLIALVIEYFFFYYFIIYAYFCITNLVSFYYETLQVALLVVK